MATPGEFTLQAFMNGKMDLSQAEAVADLIASSSGASHNMAMNQMRGGFSKQIAALREKLLQFISMVELELDFSEEDVEFADRARLFKLVEQIHGQLSRLAQSFRVGNALKNGIPVAIIGKPNVGKSTLLNTLLDEEKAIVSEVPGTTRDYIEDVILIEGIAFRFIDTAGLRETKDKVETLGVARTREKIQQASIILYLIDAHDKSTNFKPILHTVKKMIDDGHKQVIYLLNKIDKADDDFNDHPVYGYFDEDDTVIGISAKKDINIERLSRALVDIAKVDDRPGEDVIVNNLRHYEALENAREGLNRVMNGLETGISADLLAQDIRQVLHYLGEITGEITTDEILGNIFRNFCIGK